MNVPILERTFYAASTLQVARALLGQRLVRCWNGERLSGRIVEVEAYIGTEDAACHARCGRTPRNAVMFGPPGHAYVYFIYGMYHCLNLVTEAEGFPAAVLIRALEPLEGVALMQEARGKVPWRDLLRGPGRLCQALRIDLGLNGADVCQPESGLWVEADEPVPDAQVETTPRINVRGDALALSRPWRWVIRGHPCVSGTKPLMPIPLKNAVPSTGGP